MKNMMVAGVSVLVALGSACAAVDATKLTEEGMFPFLPSYDAPVNVVNMSHLLEAPAGKHGHIRIEDGHFVNDKGRMRFNGINLTGPANFPTHEEADRLAARLARFGFNCVRLHFFDVNTYRFFTQPPAPGIILEDYRTQRRFDPKQRDRMDYLIAQLKKRGIYVNLNLHVARILDERDGFTTCVPWLGKGVGEFDPRIIAEEKAYAKELLSHVNPYTGMSYLKDPVVVMVELNNEDGLTDMYLGGHIDGIGQPYATSLKILWNEWLDRTYGTTEKMLAAWTTTNAPTGKTAYKIDGLTLGKGTVPVLKKSAAAPEPVRRDFYRFLLDTERAYFTDMRNYLKNDLGLKAPVSGTQVGSPWRYGWSAPHVQAELDYVDNHGYWCHPHVGSKWVILNGPMSGDPRGGKTTELAAMRVAGKPYTVSEYNHPYPNFYGAEGQAMLRAYGAFQDWDGVFAYSYNNSITAEPTHNEYFFSLAARSDVLAHFPACAAMYLRGDVRRHERMVVANFPFADYFERLCADRRVPQSTAQSKSALPQSLGLLHGIAMDVTGKTADSPAPGAFKIPLGPRMSDTKELIWNTEKGGAHWIVNTANTKFFSGVPNGRTFDLGGVMLTIGETKLGWATVSLVSQQATGFGEDGRPTRILLAATGLCHNGGAKFTTEHKGALLHSRGADWGTGKTMCEGIPATVTLPAPAAQTTCHALDERGEPKATLAVTADANGRAVIKIDPSHKTVWYEITVTKK